MKINTKADVGQYIYYICNNQAYSEKVVDIYVKIQEELGFVVSPNIQVSYTTRTNIGLREEDIFTSKEDLAADLIKNVD